MLVSDVIDLAVQTELKNTAVVDDIPTMLSYLNLGMISLYTKFDLSTKEHIIELLDGVDIYDMPADFMWLVAAYDEVPEDSQDVTSIISVNEEDNPASINTVTWNQIQVPVTVTGAYISIIYKDSPPYYTEATMGQDIAIPVQLVEALLAYMAYKEYSSVKSDIQDENNVYLQRYEALCNRILTLGAFTSDDMKMTNRKDSRGFV